MIRPDGIVKLLDFGLAKTVRGTDEDSVTMAKTRPGLIMGTAAYMSPEQTRAVATDERTDIWSLGAVFYEMLTGEVPFKGDTSSDVIASILRSDPIAPTSIVPTLPPLFDPFFARTLSKDKEHRFASIDELVSELALLKASLVSAGSSTTLKRWKRSRNAATTEGRASLKTLSGAAPQGKSSSGSLKWLYAATLLIIAIPSAAYFAWSRMGTSSGPASSVAPVSRVQKRLTTYGDVTNAVISPDGRSVAYVSKQGTATSLLVQQIESSEFVTVLPPVSDYIRQVTFSPDSRYIYFLRQYNRRQSFMILFRVPVSGGEPEQIVFDVDHGVSFSPDGTQMVFRREFLDEKLSRIFIANIDGSNERLLAERTRPDGFMNSPVWSPNGKTIASNVNDPTLSSLEFATVAIDVASGETKPVGNSHWRWVEGLAWDPSGDALILTAQEAAARPDQLWRISYQSGEVSRITDDFNQYRGATVSADGSQIVSVQHRQDMSLFVGSADTPDTASRVLAIQGLSYYGIAFAPNGNVIYSCNADGNRQIWSVGADGTERKMLTRDDTVKDRPAVSPDGRYIVFRHEQDNRGSIVRMNLDGSEITELTNGPSDTDPTVSADSQWVFYTSSAEGRTQPMLWKVSINGGTPVQVTTSQTVSPEASPDGKFIAGYYVAPSLEGESVLTLFNAQTGEVERLTTVRNSKFQWRPSFASPSLVNLNDEVTNIESFSFERNLSKKLSSFTTGQITDFAYSADGKQIAMIRGSVTNSVVVLTAERRP
jgi:Tol biopolymer transport system component